VDEERIGYKFEVLGSHDCNQEDLILELYEKIKRGLSMKYLEHGELGKQIKDMSVVGRIEWDDEYEGQIPELCIDGERITWYEFGKMLMTFEGWQFQLNIFDRTDEVTKSLN